MCERNSRHTIPIGKHSGDSIMLWIAAQNEGLTEDIDKRKYIGRATTA